MYNIFPPTFLSLQISKIVRILLYNVTKIYDDPLLPKIDGKFINVFISSLLSILFSSLFSQPLLLSLKC